MSSDFPDSQPPEVIKPSALETIIRTECDVAIATAHRFPRQISSFFKRAESLATATPEIAASCEYAKPVGGGKVKGPSARLAEIVAATYGNLRVQARVIAETDSEIVAQGVAHDLETNVAHSTEVTVSILTKEGRRYGPDQVATVRGAACSKARRNAIFLAVPVALCQPIIAAARKVAAGDAQTLPERRAKTLDWFAQKGVKLDAILSWLEVKAVEDIGLEQMADLIAAQNTAREDGVSIAHLFAQGRGGNAESLQEKMKADIGPGQQKAAPAASVKQDAPPTTSRSAPLADKVSVPPVADLLSAFKRASQATTPEQAQEAVDRACGASTPPDKVAATLRAAVITALNELAG